MMVLYHSLMSLLFAAALPLLPLVWMVSEKRRANLLQRLGFYTGFSEKRRGRFRIWIHALSVGEVSSAVPLVQELRKKRPGAEIVFTASTRTGFQTACRALGPESGDVAVEIGYFPFDLWFSIQRVMSKIGPDLVILVETDLWPGFISMASKRGIPVVLANARLSAGAHRGYCRFRLFFGQMFEGLSHIMAQTRTDAQRFIDVGGREDRISVPGNIKFDRPQVEMDEGTIEEIRTELGLSPGQQAWIAGSTHEGEEELVVSAFEGLRPQFRTLKLIIAPRDPDRAPALARELGRGPHETACLSDPLEEKVRADILIIDRLGVLMSAYAAGSLAFVGGSLVDQGGHNPLEPAMFGKPVIFGPHMEDFHEVGQMLKDAGGALQVDSGASLAAITGSLLGNREKAEGVGKTARKVFFNNSGAVARTIEIMEAVDLV